MDMEGKPILKVHHQPMLVMVDNESMALSSQSLHNGNTIISSPEIFLPGADELQKHFISDCVFHYPLCIAIKHMKQTPREGKNIYFRNGLKRIYSLQKLLLTPSAF